MSDRSLQPTDDVAERRVTSSHVDWVAERMSDRDWAIAETVNRLRLVRGDQLERLVFFDLSGRSGAVSRGRVLHRLAAWAVLDVLPRRVGGARFGSSMSVFALGPAGQRLLMQQLSATERKTRVRHPGLPSERMVKHVLAVSELCVGLAEEARFCGVKLAAFEAEPACWWPDGLDGYLKPDAYVLLESEDIREHSWVEVDLGPESLPTLKRKLLTYLDFVHRGQLGPSGVVPRVLITAHTANRVAAISGLVSHLPEPAGQLFTVTIDRQARLHLIHSLKE
jgi:hypothetical protein